MYNRSIDLCKELIPLNEILPEVEGTKSAIERHQAMNLPATYDEDQSRLEVAGSVIQSLFDKHCGAQWVEAYDDTNVPDKNTNTFNEQSKEIAMTQYPDSIGAACNALESCY